MYLILASPIKNIPVLCFWCLFLTHIDIEWSPEVNPLNLTTSQVVLSFTAAEDLYLGKSKILESEVISEIKGEFSKNKTSTLFLRADFSVKYGKVASLMSFLKRNGITQIALVTEIDTK